MTPSPPWVCAEALPEILTSYADFERIYGGYADLAQKSEVRQLLRECVPC